MQQRSEIQLASLIAEAADELEDLRNHHNREQTATHFPRACRRLLRALPGNSHCTDCGRTNPDWASITYGSLYCLNCSGRHRSYGVKTSVVRSVDLDAWTHTQVLAVLEGGNAQLEGFFDRHYLGRTSPKAVNRYHTKAAQFYATNLQQHVRMVSDAGEYRGREASRRLYKGHHHQQRAEASAVAQNHQKQKQQQVASSSSMQPITVP